jgi:hypothetical protein
MKELLFEELKKTNAFKRTDGYSNSENIVESLSKHFKIGIVTFKADKSTTESENLKNLPNPAEIVFLYKNTAGIYHTILIKPPSPIIKNSKSLPNNFAAWGIILCKPCPSPILPA